MYTLDEALSFIIKHFKVFVSEISVEKCSLAELAHLKVEPQKRFFLFVIPKGKKLLK